MTKSIPKLPASIEEGTAKYAVQAYLAGVVARAQINQSHIPRRNHLCSHSSTERKLSPPSKGGEFLSRSLLQLFANNYFLSLLRLTHMRSAGFIRTFAKTAKIQASVIMERVNA